MNSKNLCVDQRHYVEGCTRMRQIEPMFADVFIDKNNEVLVGVHRLDPLYQRCIIDIVACSAHPT